MKWTTSGDISFPGTVISIRTSPKGSKGEYLADGNYSLQGGNNFETKNGLVSSYKAATAVQKPQEIILDKAVPKRDDWLDMKLAFGDAFNITRKDYEALTGDEVVTMLKTIQMGMKMGVLKINKAGKAVVKQTKTLLQQAFAERERTDYTGHENK